MVEGRKAVKGFLTKVDDLSAEDALVLFRESDDAVRADAKCVLAAVKKNGLALHYATTQRRAEKEVVLAAAANKVFHERWLADSLKSDREFVLEAKELVLSAVNQNGFAPGDANGYIQEVTAVNVKFYRGEMSCSAGHIQELHGMKGNYSDFEMSDTCLQWFFPNYLADSWTLTKEEAAVFRSDMTIAQRYLTSYEVFLDYLGLHLYDWATGSVGRIPGEEERLHEALVVHPHNQLRVQELLASLAVTGFRQYMAPLVHHLEWEITGENEYVTLPSNVTIFDDARMGTPALGALWTPAHVESILDTWVAYVDGNEEHFMEYTKASPDDNEPSVLFADAVTVAQWESEETLRQYT